MTQKIPKSKENYLEQIGYSSKDKREKRRNILEKGIKEKGYKPIISRLNALSVRIKNSSSELSHQIKEDMQWAKLKFRS